MLRFLLLGRPKFFFGKKGKAMFWKTAIAECGTLREAIEMARTHAEEAGGAWIVRCVKTGLYYVYPEGDIAHAEEHGFTVVLHVEALHPARCSEAVQ